MMTKKQNEIRKLNVGVDVGGTFTDLVLFDDEGNLQYLKESSTPSDQSVGIMKVMEKAAQRLGIDVTGIGHFVHGTTVATNALIERTGAKTGLITTEGFRDVLQIGRHTRPHLFDLKVRRHPPLVPRHLRLEVAERIAASGEILRPLDETHLGEALATLVGHGVTAIAVCLLNSYRNPVHEERIGEIIARQYPAIAVGLSSRILPEIQEYERSSTTTINSYLTPLMGRYLTRLVDKLKEQGIRAAPHIMQSGGGLMRAGQAADRPVHTILSGPAGGVLASAFVAGKIDAGDVVTIDMGGTSADISLVFDGTPVRSADSEFEGLPIAVPMLDIHAIGAGGGSQAWIDKGGAMRVGPQSSGADPGPVCYGRGGDVPTVSDANLVLGRLDTADFLGGDMTLRCEPAQNAIAEVLAGPLNMDTFAAAEGVIRVVNAAMAAGIRKVTVERGHDPRGCTLMAFGGAGPLHAGALAREIGIDTIVIPAAPGNFSAFGLLTADTRYDYVATVFKPMDELTPVELSAAYERLVGEAARRMSAERYDQSDITFVKSAELRYVRQSFRLHVPVYDIEGDDGEMAAIVDRFHAEHRRAYGYASETDPVEVVNVRLTAIGRIPTPELRPLPARTPADGPLAGIKRDVFFDDAWRATDVYRRRELLAGDRFRGPAIVQEAGATTVVEPGFSARIDDIGNIVMKRDDR
jgi:N-methylhydantoinase A